MDWKLCILCQTKTREALQNQRSENMRELQPVIKGMSKANPGKSCREILDSSKNDQLDSGLYWIQPDGDAFPVQGIRLQLESKQPQ